MSSSRKMQPAARRDLERLAAGDGLAAQRARAVLAWLTGKDLGRAAEVSGLRGAQVRYWVTLFQRSGVAPFFAQPHATAAKPATPVVATRKAPAGPRLRGTDLVTAALARIVVFQFRKVKKLEGAASGGDEEAVHDMRVAIRRVRAALRIARPFFPGKPVRRLRACLQETAEMLGKVRDLDVMVEHARRYAEGQSEDARPLDGWIDALTQQQADAREAVRAHLSGKRYARLRAESRGLLAAVRDRAGANSPAPGALGAPRVLDILPGAIWAQYGAVRAYETIAEPTTDSLHALRIEIKRLRYILEFFRRPLGARVVPAIEAAIGAQDRLGHLHDLCVAADMLDAWLHTLSPDGPAHAPSAAVYLALLHDEIQTHLSQGATLWAELGAPAFRRRIGRLIERL